MLLIFMMIAQPLKAEPRNQIVIHKSSKIIEAPVSEKYQWYFNGKKLVGETNKTLFINNPGHYTVVLIQQGAKTIESVNVTIVNGKIVRIFLIGDSTMQDYSVRSNYLTDYYPMTGWGEKLQSFLQSDSLSKIKNILNADSVQVFNYAKGGRSTRLFWQEGSWSQVESLLQPGDYVFIQFGHNDEASCTDYPDRCTSLDSFKIYLRWYVESSRTKGAIPLLLTPVNRDYPWSGGVLNNVHGEYPGAMKQVASELHVPLIDITQRSIDFFTSKGETHTTNHYFMVFPAGTYPTYKVTADYPNGSPSNDKTHFQTEGATEVARMVFEGLQDLVDVTIDVPCDTCGEVMGAGWYEKLFAKDVTVGAQPKRGWVFQEWSGDFQSNDNPFTLPLDSNIHLTAGFTETNLTQYTFATGIEGSGTVTSEPFGNLIIENTSMTLNAVPEDNWNFYSWFGDTIVGSNPFQFDIKRDMAVSAFFIESDAKIFQAEDNTFENATVENTANFYTGTSYLKTSQTDTTRFTWYILPDKSAYYAISFRYSSETSQTIEADLIVNDVLDNGKFKVDNTGSESSWLYSTQIYHKFEIQPYKVSIAFNKPEDQVNIDFFKIRGQGNIVKLLSDLKEHKNDFIQEMYIYPNPGSLQIRLVLNLKYNTDLSVDVYNQLGQVIEHLPSHQYSAGYNEILFVNDKLTPGLYKCTVRNNLNFQSVNFVILK